MMISQIQPPQPQQQQQYCDSQTERSSDVSSVDSDRSNVQTIAAQLGIVNPEDIYIERFKVERKKLADMIRKRVKADVNEAELFFAMIMRETQTHINWPLHLKLEAKTRKDPHVKVLGRKPDVLEAKRRILAALNVVHNRVIMKVDVPYTDHSYIIGRSGNNIKRIMEETKTHIHFPDSNRSNTMEKSNQVSICGSIDGVEKARSLVRWSAPLLFSFEMPVLGSDQTPPDNNTDFVKEIEREFSVQVIFSTRPKLHSYIVLVKGGVIEAGKVKEATRRLISFICGQLADQITVQLQLEISIQHHAIVLGKNAANLRSIMAYTGTKIMFPDANDLNIKPLKKSQVTIIGTIEGVFSARQYLLGCIPITLIFDSMDNNLNFELINKLMYSLDVFITVRQKSRQSTLCIVIKGIEKFVNNIYEARHRLLSLDDETRVVAEIPPNFFLPEDHMGQKRESMVQLLSSSLPLSLPPTLQLPSIMPNLPTSPMVPWFPSQPQQQPQLLPQPSTQPPPPPPPAIWTTADTDLNGAPFAPMHDSISTHYSDALSSGYASLSISGVSSPRSDSVSSSDAGVFGGELLDDYERRIVAGYRAIATPPRGEMRTPTSAWQNLGLSRTSPAALEQQTERRGSASSPSFFNATTRLVDFSEQKRPRPIHHFSDVASVLTALGLDHHIQHFVNGEIDMPVFLTLTDHDLVNLGVKPLGARRRILMAIHELQMERSRQTNSPVFSGSAAPGAERRFRYKT